VWHYGYSFRTSVRVSYPGDKLMLLILFVCFPFILYQVLSENQQKIESADQFRLFSVFFADSFHGAAVSYRGDTLLTTDGGICWAVKNELKDKGGFDFHPSLWKVDIFCSVIHTTDGGNNWYQYDNDNQDRFSAVYLVDKSTGYILASDFLKKVTREIFFYSESDEINLLTDNNRSFNEYFRIADEAWTVRWCIKNFNRISSR
jgi:hypothetical protein